MAGHDVTDAMTEEDWTEWVIDVAHAFGWLAAHFRPARTARGWRTSVQGDTGSPDVLLARGGVVLLAELKRNTGRLRPEQKVWIAALGQHARVWRPRDRDEVLRTLREGP